MTLYYFAFPLALDQPQAQVLQTHQSFRVSVMICSKLALRDTGANRSTLLIFILALCVDTVHNHSISGTETRHRGFMCPTEAVSMIKFMKKYRSTMIVASILPGSLTPFITDALLQCSTDICEGLILPP